MSALVVGVEGFASSSSSSLLFALSLICRVRFSVFFSLFGTEGSFTLSFHCWRGKRCQVRGILSQVNYFGFPRVAEVRGPFSFALLAPEAII